MVKDWILSPGSNPPKMAKGDVAKSEKSESKSRKAIDFTAQEDDQTIVRTSEMRVLPGDKRLAETPENKVVAKKTNKGE